MSFDKKNYMKEYMKTYNKEKVFCNICKKEYMKYNKNHHFKTKKHILGEKLISYDEKLNLYKEKFGLINNDGY